MNTNILTAIILYTIGAAVYIVQSWREVTDTITKDLRKDFNDSGIAMLVIAVLGFVAVTYFVGFDLASMTAAVLMGFIGWAIAFPEDSAECDDDCDYYEE